MTPAAYGARSQAKHGLPCTDCPAPPAAISLLEQRACARELPVYHGVLAQLGSYTVYSRYGKTVYSELELCTSEPMLHSARRASARVSGEEFLSR